MAMRLPVYVLVILSLALTCTATTYTVGDNSGWDISSDLQTWEKNKTFYVGDVLGTYSFFVFTFSSYNSFVTFVLLVWKWKEGRWRVKNHFHFYYITYKYIYSIYNLTKPSFSTIYHRVVTSSSSFFFLIKLGVYIYIFFFLRYWLNSWFNVPFMWWNGREYYFSIIE